MSEDERHKALETLIPFDSRKDYFREFYKLYLENENLMADIDRESTEKHRLERRILSIYDFYDCTLIPAIVMLPHKFLHRKRMLKLQQKMQVNAQLSASKKYSDTGTGQHENEE